MFEVDRLQVTIWGQSLGLSSMENQPGRDIIPSPLQKAYAGDSVANGGRGHRWVRENPGGSCLSRSKTKFRTGVGGGQMRDPQDGQV